jgi:prolyl oligopeptidase
MLVLSGRIGGISHLSRHVVLFVICMAMGVALVWAPVTSGLAGPPPTKTVSVVEDIHGRQVADPYRWLEDADAPEVQAWIDAQNAYTRTILDTLSQRTAIGRRLEDLLSIGSVGAPRGYRGRYFYTKRVGDQDHSVLYVRNGLGGDDRVLIDPNELDDQGLVTLDYWHPSKDGSLLIYGLSREGTEMATLHVMNVETREILSDEISRARHSSVSWSDDNSGFFYTRLPAPGSVPEGEESYHRHVYYHRLGRDPGDDPKVFGEGRDMTEWAGIEFSPEDRYLMLSVWKGYTESNIYFKPFEGDPDLVREEGFIPVVEGKEAIFQGQIVGSTIYIHTNYEAPNYRLLRADLRDPRMANWSEVIPETAFPLQGVVVVGDWVVAQYMENASHRLKVFSLAGDYLREIELPTLGTVRGLNGRWDGTEVMFTFSSNFVPPTAYRYDLVTGDFLVFDRVEADIDPSGYELHQVWYESKDGTPVSMFLVHRKGLELDGANPAFLTGYGGFNNPAMPGFQRNIYLWLERGGIYAEPNLRGGSEYGEEWHRAGMLGNKQNVFDDFIAAAEWLFEEGYTRPDRLVIDGGSNGGLLVGAVMVQRPDICRVVLCWNPVLDMIRYHMFLLARYWTTEYGDPEKPEDFKWLYAYSPYHNIVDGASYPSTMVMTSDSDTRVHPMHAMKMVAGLQAATSSESPIVLRFDRQSGHAGAPLSKIVEDYTDRWSFVFWQLGMEY